MTNQGLAKFKIIAISTGVIGILATIILGSKLVTDLAECPPYMNGDACTEAYFAMTSYGKNLFYGVILSSLIATVGIVLVVIWFIMRMTQNKVPVTPELKELREAEREYARAVKEAEKAHRATVSSYEKVVKQAAKTLKNANEMGQRKLAKHQSAVLYEDRIETPEGTASFIEGPVETEVNPSGNLVIGCSGFRSLILGKPEQIEKVREFATKINDTAAAAPRLKEEKTQAIINATAELEAANRNLEQGANEALMVLAKVKESTARIDMARAAIDGNAVARPPVTAPVPEAAAAVQPASAPMPGATAAVQPVASAEPTIAIPSSDIGGAADSALEPDSSSQTQADASAEATSQTENKCCTGCGVEVVYSNQGFCTNCGTALA